MKNIHASRFLQSFFTRHPAILAILFLLVLCALNYAGSLGNDFFLDDFSFLKSHPGQWGNFVLDNFKKTPNQHYQPVYFLSNTILFHFLAHQPILMRLLHIFLIFMNGFLLYRLILMLTRRPFIALMTSSIFCVHPINSMSFLQLNHSSILLYGIGMQLALLTFWQSREPGQYKKMFTLLSLFSFAFSLLCFETALLLPFYIFLILYYFKKSPIKDALRACLPHGLVAVLFTLLWMGMVGGKSTLFEEPIKNVSFWNYTASYFYLCLWYLSQLFFPGRVVLIFNISPITTNLWLWNAGLFFFISGLIYLIKKTWNTLHGFALLWFLPGFVLVAPAMFTHIYMGLIIEPHWLFFSSMGFFLFLASLLEKWTGHFPRKRFFPIYAVLIAGLILLSQWHIALFANQKTFCWYWLSVTPRNYIAWNALGAAYFREGDVPKALACYNTASRYGGYHAYESYCNAGIVALSAGDKKQASRYFKKSLDSYPNYAPAYGGLARAAQASKDYTRAEMFYKKALAYGSFNFMLESDLINLLIQQDKESEAIERLTRLLARNLSSRARSLVLSKLIVLHYKNNQSEQAQRLLDAFEKNNPRLQDILMLIQSFEEYGFIAFARSITEEALKNFKKKSDIKELYLYHGVLLAKEGKMTQAIQSWERGLKIAPTDSRLLQNLEKAAAGQK